MLTTAERATVVAPVPSSEPRVVLAPERSRRAVLDGGWWPRSWDAVAELPGLVRAVSARFGAVRHVMLNSASWRGRFGRLAVGDAVVRVGWFANLDPAVAIATTNGGDQVDLLVVPPSASAQVAEAAMAAAADPANLARAQAVLAAVRLRGSRAAEQPVWDNEGGHLAESRSRDEAE